MSLEKRLAIFTEALTIISEADCTVSAVLIRKDEIEDSGLEIDMVALELLFERLCIFHDAANVENRTIGRDEQYGILMIDSVNPNYDNKTRAKVRFLFKNGTRHVKNHYLIEDPIFVDSSYRHLSQLVDCVAYCIRRNFRKSKVDERERETFESFFNLIEPKLLKNGDNTEDCGLEIFPKSRDGRRGE